MPICGSLSNKNTWKIVGILFFCLIVSSLVGGFFGAMAARTIGAMGGVYIMLFVTGKLAGSWIKAQFLSLAEIELKSGCAIYIILMSSLGLCGGLATGVLSFTESATLVFSVWRTWSMKPEATKSFQI